MLANHGHRMGYNVGMAILCVSTIGYGASLVLPYWFSYGDRQWLAIQATDRPNVWRLCVHNQTICYDVQDDDTNSFSGLLVDYANDKAGWSLWPKEDLPWKVLAHDEGIYYGLWRLCLQSGCHVIKGGVNVWTQVMGCACLALMVVSTSLAGVVSFCPQRVPSRTRTPEIVTAIGSFLGFVGAFIFLSSKIDEVNFSKNHPAELDASFDLGFVLSALAAAGGLLSASILAFFNKFVPGQGSYFFLTEQGQLVKLGGCQT